MPILLYNIPSRTGTNMTAATTLRLSEHPNIIGTKEASGDLLQCMEIAKGKHNNFLIISGEDMLTLAYDSNRGSRSHQHYSQWVP